MVGTGCAEQTDAVKPISAHARSRLVERVEAVCASTLDERALRAEILEILQPAIGFDAYVWLLTDPATEVGSAPLADVPGRPELPSLIRHKYLNQENRWTSLSGNAAPARLAGGPADRPPTPWRALLAANDIGDVASMAFRDRHGCWAFLDLWRERGRGAFADADLDLLAATLEGVTLALRRRQAATFGPREVSQRVTDGPAVLVLDDDLRTISQTSAATEWLRRLLPTTPGIAPIPAAALNVAAQLVATEAGIDVSPASTRTYAAGQTWVTLRASRLEGGPPPGLIAVSIEETPAAARLELFARTHAFTPREADLLRQLSRGLDTRELSSAMGIREVTVHAHLKSIFAKTSLNTRTALLTAALGPASAATGTGSGSAQG